MNLTLHEVADAVKAQNDVLKYEDQVLGNIEFDSRLIKPGDIFLPLKGARDGHDFIPTAFENGALVTFSEQKVAFPHILVENTEQAFQDLASYYLDKTAVDVIAITGSNGKTTTKDMIAQILATTYKTYKTQGNYNNEIGLPYTVLHMPDDTEKLVLEMGQDHMGDIHLLSTLAKPKLAVITLIGESHLEFFGTREKIAEGKMQIIDGLVHGGELIAPADKIINAYLPNNQKITRFGADADIHLTALYEHKDHLSFTVNFLDEDLTIPVPGKFNATNAMKLGSGDWVAAVTQSTTAAFIGMIASSVVLILSLMKQGDIANIANPGPSKHQINAMSLLTQTLTQAIPFIVIGSAIQIFKLIDQTTFPHVMRMIANYTDAQLAIFFSYFSANTDKLTMTPVWGAKLYLALDVYREMMTYLASTTDNADWTMPEGVQKTGNELTITN